MGVYGEKAHQLFLAGYNCSQAVLCAFCEDVGLNETVARAISSSFGGGMGRLREVCGALSGAFMILGLKYGGYDPKDQQKKKIHYHRIQEFAALFRQQNGSIICREMLGLKAGPDSATPEQRTLEYYRKRPCPEIVACTADLLADYIRKLEKEET